ncbi:Crp/Fnr family transcriptional regulator [Micromonospora craniellae]|uniref:Crp/Fnr family transcriptional regulator n=1 Tax=Micromonospora craniellae TaxID=2294034 RepID=A0A372G353_9ACTN|nr:Crp/Fnr family transcriptional regulator [Micromonospora craniellae]QOC92064.1 Crp/Fnr family transcriptional regulator [Micromonospora craniellae]RFS47477.1 Crp/Fnr family transcriptional regulator [Micromonospora craniellae]
MTLASTRTPTSVLDDMLVPRGSELTHRLMKGVRSALYSPTVAARRVALAGGELLHQPGGADGRVYFIESGAICLEHYSPTGRRTILDVLSKNEYFGEDSLPGMPNQYIPAAVVDTSLIVVESAALRDLLDEPNICDVWLHSQMLKARRHRSLLLQHTTSDCEARLAMRLLDLAQGFGAASGRSVRIGLKLRHEDYAAMIGTTRSRVGLFLQRFTDRKMIRKASCGAIVADPRLIVEYLMERMGLASGRLSRPDAVA